MTIASCEDCTSKLVAAVAMWYVMASVGLVFLLVQCDFGMLHVCLSSVKNISIKY